MGLLSNRRSAAASQTPQHNYLRGIILSFSGYTVWVGSDVLTKLAGNSLPIFEILSINLFVGSLFTVLLAYLKGGLRQLTTQRFGFYFILSVLTMGTAYGSIAGVIYLPLADFYTIVFMSPLLLAALGYVVLKEKVDFGMWLAIIFGFCGVAVAVRSPNTSSSELPWFGVTATCLSALSMVLAMLTVRAAGKENNYSLSLWPQLVTCGVSVIVMLVLGDVVANLMGMTYAFLSGVFSAIGLLMTNASLRIAPVAVVSPYHYTQIVGGAAIGYLIWGHIPSFSMILGAGMIMTSGLYVLAVSQKQPELALTTKETPKNLG